MVKYKKLEKLADFLDKLPPDKFDFAHLVRKVKGCGSVCCAIGWTPEIFPGTVRWIRAEKCYGAAFDNVATDKNLGYLAVARELFNISFSEAERLFTPEIPRPWSHYKGLSQNARPKTVANSIRKFIEWRKNK